MRGEGGGVGALAGDWVGERVGLEGGVGGGQGGVYVTAYSSLALPTKRLTGLPADLCMYRPV